MKDAIKEEYKQYTIGLALFDLLPVLLFLMSGMVIRSMFGSPVFLAGVVATFLGGSCKVLWKLIVVLKHCDVKALTKAFRILMLGGFGLMLLSVVIRGSFAGPVRGLTMMPAAIFFAVGIAGMCLMGYLGAHMDSSARSNWIEEAVNTLAQLAILIGVIMVYLGTYYHASDTALKALESNDEVNVTTIEEGYYFDGEGTDSALIFYPGAKVETEAYAPLMMKIAEGGTDCYLCRMPQNIALFGKSMADEIKSDALAGNNTYTGADNNYDKWYIGGHSLGGAAASMLVAEKQDEWAGVIFLASYPTDEIDIPVLSIYGSEDTVLSADNYADAGKDGLWPDDFTEEIIEGGNHAGFGDYGDQKGDGQASITAEEQQALTTEIISRWTELQSGAR